METNRIPVAVIGLGSFGCLTLQALQQIESVKIVGVGDKNLPSAAEAGRTYNVPSFSDSRSLLAEARPKVVFLALPPMEAPDLILTCAERGIHVWKELPLARNLAEAVPLVTRMEEAGLKFAVGTQRRFAKTYRRAWELRQQIGRVFLGRAHYLFNWGPNLAWRGDMASAGGGALLELGYHPIDLMVWMLGLPTDVYGIQVGGKQAPLRLEGKAVPPYDTDDTAAALLRYSGGGMASVVTTRCSGPVSEELSLHGRDGSLVVNSEAFTLRTPDGSVLDRTTEDNDPLAVFRRQAEAFIQAVQTNAKTYECSARENLLPLSVIEAAYLSNRTCQPESPLRLLKTYGLSAEKCLKHRPPVPAPPLPAPKEPTDEA